MSEKGDVLLRNSKLLSDKLISSINSFLDYELSEKIYIKILSGEENLKAKSCEVFGENPEYYIEGFATANMDICFGNIILSDYIIIHTSVMKMAPLSLTELLKKLSPLNKKAFVIFDKWNMMPKTKQNIEKVKKNALREFSSVNIMGIYNIFEEPDDDFYSLDVVKEIIAKIIIDDFRDTRKHQLEQINLQYLELVKQEYLEIKKEANDTRIKLERYIHNVKVLRKKKMSFNISAKAKGAISYKVTKGAKYISVSKKGKVIINKKSKKGTYKILITAAETDEYKQTKRYVVILIK